MLSELINNLVVEYEKLDKSGCPDGGCCLRMPMQRMCTNGGCRCMHYRSFTGTAEDGMKLRAIQRVLYRVQEIVKHERSK